MGPKLFFIIGATVIIIYFLVLNDPFGLLPKRVPDTRCEDAGGRWIAGGYCIDKDVIIMTDPPQDEPD
jgi:hypothetical protein